MSDPTPPPSTAPQSAGEVNTHARDLGGVANLLEHRMSTEDDPLVRENSRQAAETCRRAATALQASEAARTLAERERDEARRIAGMGCDANGGGAHSAMTDRNYRFCQDCGETLKGVALSERLTQSNARATLAEARVGELEAEREILPFNVKIAHITYRKGVKLQTFIDAATRWHAAAGEKAVAETQLTASKSRVGELEEGLNRALNALAMITVSWGLTPDDDDAEGWCRKADTKRSQAQTALAELGWGIDWNAIGAGETDPNNFRALLSPSQGEKAVSDWKCCGCGKPAPDQRRNCNCPTGVLYREGTRDHVCKIEPVTEPQARATADAGEMPSREQIARVIDPDAWAEHRQNLGTPLGGWVDAEKARALKTADAILALRKPTADAERLEEVVTALGVAQSLMLAKGWWRNEAGYLTDAALWIDSADRNLKALTQDAGAKSGDQP